jgi:hypothetical protein
MVVFFFLRAGLPHGAWVLSSLVLKREVLVWEFLNREGVFLWWKGFKLFFGERSTPTREVVPN